MISPPDPLVAVVVVNYGSSYLLQQNLVGLEKHVGAVVVVDNFSDATERRRVLALGRLHGWSVLTPATNEGFGAGMNLGAAQALSLGASTLVLLNPDAVLADGALEALTGAVRRGGRTIVAPTILKPDGTMWSPGLMVVDLENGRTRSARSHAAHGGGSEVLTWLSGACLALGAELWRELGGFDRDYFLYWEDVDLCVRATRADARLEVVDDAVVVHDEGATHTKVAGPAKSPVYYYYATRNRLLFAAKLLDPATRRRWRRTALMAAYEITLRGGRRQLLTSSTPWTAPLRGTLAGLTIAARADRRQRAPGPHAPSRGRPGPDGQGEPRRP